LCDRILTSCQARSHPYLIQNAIASLPSQQQSAIASSPHAKRDRIQQLQQQIEAWQALLEKLGERE
jgi:polyhydroxyalkanoate synthesis regulator protein